MVFVFSLLLILGILSGQWFDLSYYAEVLSFAASLCLAYIMMEVGLEFSVEKRSVASYGKDFLIASTAAILPALLWIGYFLIIVHSNGKAALLSGLSSAPTSAGVLFAMLTAAGLSATWVFQKARILAVLDDLVTILLLTPLTLVIHGFEWRSVAALALVVFAVLASFRWQNVFRIPVTPNWLLLYSFVLTAIIFFFNKTTHIHLDVLIPAFMCGCLIHKSVEHPSEGLSHLSLDIILKGAFMLLVGLNFPKIAGGSISWMQTAGHVILLTVLANIGKLFLVFCYKREASLKERIALGVAMFPRGEVGAAVLLIGIGYGLGGYENTLAILSLALNLVLTGGFIWIVIRLLRSGPRRV